MMDIAQSSEVALMLSDVLKNVAIIFILLFTCFLIWKTFKFAKFKIAQKIDFEIKCSDDMRELKKYEVKIKSSEEKIRRIDNSLKLADFIKNIAGQLVVIRFQNFKDGHDIGKVTEENIKRLVSEIAIEVRSCIRYDEIDFDILVLTKEFYDNYIINTIVIMIKRLLDKAVDEYEEE